MAVCLSLLREQRLYELIRKSGYQMHQFNGQRRYGPPPSWVGPPPQKGSEVFIGKLPRDLYEDELVPLFETIGLIYELRLMMDFSGSNRGFGFVMYTNPSDAEKSIKQLDNFEIRKGRKIGVCKSVDNCRLFVGGIPKDKTRAEIFNEFTFITDGVLDVILYNNVLDKAKNRGFAFIEYDSHRSAAMARRKLIPGRIPLWGHELAVDWAEPEPQVKAEVMNRFKNGLLKYEQSQSAIDLIKSNSIQHKNKQMNQYSVTVLYARNLTLSTTEERLQEIFSISGHLRVDKVKKIRDYAFIHYFTREEAEVALANLNGIVVDNSIMEVTWSKPPECSLRHQSNYTVDGYRSYPRHCLAINANNMASDSNFSRNLRQELASSASFARSALNERLGSNMNFEPRASVGVIGDPAPRSNDILPRLFARGEFSTSSPQDGAASADGIQKKHLIFQYPQILSYLCQEKGYGKPIFDMLHISNDELSQQTLYTCKVIIPNLSAVPNQFICAKFSRTPEDAKINAARYVIANLGFTDACLDFYAPCNDGPTMKSSPPEQYLPVPMDFGQGDGTGRAVSKQVLCTKPHDDLCIGYKGQGDAPFPSLASSSSGMPLNGDFSYKPKPPVVVSGPALNGKFKMNRPVPENDALGEGCSFQFQPAAEFKVPKEASPWENDDKEDDDLFSFMEMKKSLDFFERSKM